MARKGTKMSLGQFYEIVDKSVPHHNTLAEENRALKAQINDFRSQIDDFKAQIDDSKAQIDNSKAQNATATATLLENVRVIQVFRCCIAN
jgi:soluble cytochrome b562